MVRVKRAMELKCQVSRTLKKRVQKLFDKLVEYDDEDSNVRMGYFEVITINRNTKYILHKRFKELAIR